MAGRKITIKEAREMALEILHKSEAARIPEPLPLASCSPLTVDQVIVALRAMAKQEETTRRVLTGPRDATDEYSAWYASQVLSEAARLIEANTNGHAS